MSTLTRRSLLLSAAGLAGAATLYAPCVRAASGEVNIYSARHYPADEQLFARFTEESGIKVNQIKGTGAGDSVTARRRGRMMRPYRETL